LRLESIFNNIDCKNKEINNNLFKNNSKILHSEKNNKAEDYKRNYYKKNENDTFNFSTNIKKINSNNIEIFTLKNNLNFNNIKTKNNLLLRKKQRMDIRLQKSFDSNNFSNNKNNLNISSLSLLNNKIQLVIKKKDN